MKVSRRKAPPPYPGVFYPPTPITITDPPQEFPPKPLAGQARLVALLEFMKSYPDAMKGINWIRFYSEAIVWNWTGGKPLG